MKTIAEIIKSTYKEDEEYIEVRTVLRNVKEANAPDDSYEGEIVDNLRWIRQAERTFLNEELEVFSTVSNEFETIDTELFVQDISKFPNSGSIIVNRGSSTEEQIYYTGKDTANSKLTGIEAASATYNHEVGEKVYPVTAMDFWGTYEVSLEHYPIRYNHVTVRLNGVEDLVENKDFVIINEFDGDTCISGKLQFLIGGQKRRFKENELIEVAYQYFVQDIDTVQIYSKYGELTEVNVFENLKYNRSFNLVELAERDLPSYGNFKITPSISSTEVSPSPVKINIPNLIMPSEITLTSKVEVGDTEINLSSIDNFPTTGSLSNEMDDEASRRIKIGNDVINYEDIDTVNRRLVGVTNISESHSIGEEVELYNMARYVRDTIKDIINNSSLSSQLTAESVDTGGKYYLKIKSIIESKEFKLQSGTYELSYLGFKDSDAGLHEEIQSTTAFENKSYTFQQYREIARRKEIANELLGKTVSKRMSVL